MGNPKMVLDHILVLPDEPEELQNSKIHIPDDAARAMREESMSGEVIEVGPGRQLEGTGECSRLGVKKGDRILFQIHSGITVYIQDGKGKEGKGCLHRVMREPDVLVIVDKPSKILKG
jgi:co-chaperonin GroES (HSP10)